MPTKPNEHQKAPSDVSKPEQTKVENPWLSLAVGETVLACVDKPEGYHPARIERIEGEVLHLRWKPPYSNLPVFTQRRLAVGLLAKLGK